MPIFNLATFKLLNLLSRHHHSTRLRLPRSQFWFWPTRFEPITASQVSRNVHPSSLTSCKSSRNSRLLYSLYQKPVPQSRFVCTNFKFLWISSFKTECQPDSVDYLFRTVNDNQRPITWSEHWKVVYAPWKHHHRATAYNCHITLAIVMLRTQLINISFTRLKYWVLNKNYICCFISVNRQSSLTKF